MKDEILAGAGSGKTRVITSKIAWLVSELGMDPASILAVTFTNKAAAEMRERAARLEPRAGEVMIRTFHSFGCWFLRRNGRLAGLDGSFTIYDEDDQLALLQGVFPDRRRQELSPLVSAIARAKDRQIGPNDPVLAALGRGAELSEAYAAYEERLRRTGNVDFGDLISLPLKILAENQEVRERVRQRYRAVLVDEYQDSNAAQYELLKLLHGPDSHLCAVGDDDQSIYRFRGASWPRPRRWSRATRGAWARNWSPFGRAVNRPSSCACATRTRRPCTAACAPNASSARAGAGPTWPSSIGPTRSPWPSRRP